MEKSEFIGIDVSKLVIDVCFHSKQHSTFSNDEKGFRAMLQWVEKTSKISIEKIRFCFEHTGLYSLPLSEFLSNSQIYFHLVSGLRVKRSLGLVRGKNDKVDAQNLAKYAYLHRETLTPYIMPDKTIMRLRELLTLRALFIKQLGGYKIYVSERKSVLKNDDSDYLIKQSKDMIKILEKKIQETEQEAIELTQIDENIQTTFQNIRSIKGVGIVLALSMIAYTNNFKAFDTWRKFACFAGIAPFDHTSGTSIKGKTRVSPLGNRDLKTLLHLSAMSAIQHDPEMKAYYLKRVAEGKNKMSILNIIRNKILSRIFAVAQRQTPYVNFYKYKSVA